MMTTGSQQNLNSMDPPEAEVQQGEAITTELVNEIADKVYAMLLDEMRIYNERQRHHRLQPYKRGGC